MTSERPASTDPVPHRDNTCAAVVTHRPDEDTCDRIAELVRAVDRVVVIDNGSGAEALASLRHRLSPLPKVELQANQDNVGVASALNQGARRAVELGSRFLLMLDQDSVVEPDILETLADARAACPDRERVAVVGANYWLPIAGRLAVPVKTPERGFVAVTVAITSGSLLDLDAYQRVGPLRDDLFIDGVDHEYCLRLRAHGYRIIVTTRPAMRHGIGEGQPQKIMGRVRHISHHSALRRYYASRNRLALAREYWSREPSWVLGELVMIALEAAAIAVFERRRAAKEMAILFGLWHGLVGRMGKLDPPEWM